MSEPKKLLETALYSWLDGGLSYAVFNTRAETETIEYVVMQAGGAGVDDDYYAKDRGAVYEYQIVGICTNRATALDMAVAVQGRMDGAKAGLSIAGYGVVGVTRNGHVDYAQVEPDGVTIYHVGWIYEIELEEV